MLRRGEELEHLYFVINNVSLPLLQVLKRGEELEHLSITGAEKRGGTRAPVHYSNNVCPLSSSGAAKRGGP